MNRVEFNETTMPIFLDYRNSRYNDKVLIYEIDRWFQWMKHNALLVRSRKFKKVLENLYE